MVSETTVAVIAVTGLLGAVQVALGWFHMRERRDLTDRLQAADYAEYKRHLKPAAPSRPECLTDEELANREQLRKRGKQC